MRRSHLFVAAAALAASALGGSTAHADLDYQYRAGFLGDHTLQCGVPGQSMGGVCIPVGSGVVAFLVGVTDDSMQSVGYRATFTDAHGALLGGYQHGCGTGRITVPPTGATMLVYLDGPKNGPIDCAGAGTTGIATSGTVSVCPRGNPPFPCTG